MAIDFDIDIGKFFKDLLSKSKGQSKNNFLGNPYAKIIAYGSLVLIILLMYIFIFYIPTKDTLTDKEQKISQIEDLKIEILELRNKTLGEQLALDKAINIFEKLQNQFHTNDEIEELYREISTAALTNRLLISKLSKLERVPIFMAKQSQDDVNNEDQFQPNEDQYQPNEDQYDVVDSSASVKNEVAFYDFKIILDISGNYRKYLKFRKQLSKLQKLLIVIQEDIIVNKSEGRKGDIKATLILRTYQMPENDSERFIESEEVM